MAKLAQAQEPSMEEILASIRRIISDEEAPKAPPPKAAPPIAVVPPPPPPPPPEPEPELDTDDILELSEEEIAAPMDPPPPEDLAFIEPPKAEPAPLPLRPAAPLEPAPSLLSPTAGAVVGSAFSQLSAVAQIGRTLEDVVTDALRPMLREWLDTNLPTMVERMVRDEIERVARRR